MKSKLPNIILIVMDTLGAKHMSLYGYPRCTTPNLEHIARDCSVYTRCFAPACWTIPSHASIFTGLYPSQHGAYEGQYILEDRLQQFVPVLKMLGYRTFGISSNGLVSPTTGIRGFDDFVDFTGANLEKAIQSVSNKESIDIFNKPGEFASRLDAGLNTMEKALITFKYICETKKLKEPLRRAVQGLNLRIENIVRPNTFFRSSIYTEETLKRFAGIINSMNKAEEPFFIFINFMETHEKYRPPLKYRQFSRWFDKQFVNMAGFYFKQDSYLNFFLEMNRDLYDDEIYYLDDKIKTLWSIVERFSERENTVLIITSDHGEHFGEKGQFGHNLSLYNELVWVPLLVRYPQGSIPTGRDDRLVSLTDIYSTVLDLAGSPLPSPDTSISLLGTGKRELLLSQYIYPEGHKNILMALQNRLALQGRSSPLR
jgi:arylsulfatase A-like enzyme